MIYLAHKFRNSCRYFLNDRSFLLFGCKHELRNMSQIDREQVLSILSEVLDPATGQPLSKSGKLQDLRIDGDQINISLAIPNLSPEAKNKLNFACLNALYPHFPKSEVNLQFNNTKAGEKNNPLPHIKNIIAVASGKGGVGKSTIAASVATGLQRRGFKVGLLDADLYGPSVPTMFGLQGERPKMTKIHGQPKLIPIVKDGLHLMSIGFVVEPEQAVILRGPRLSGVLKQFLLDCVWPELDFLIVDLPPGTGDIQLTLVQAVSVTGAVIVTTPQEVAVADALKAANMFLMPNIDIPILGIIENMSWFTPEELPDNKYLIFGKGGGEKLSKLIDSSVLGQIPLVQGVREHADKGTIAQSLDLEASAKYVDLALDQLLYKTNIRNETQQPSRIVEIKN